MGNRARFQRDFNSIIARALLRVGEGIYRGKTLGKALQVSDCSPIGRHSIPIPIQNVLRLYLLEWVFCLSLRGLCSAKDIPVPFFRTF